MATFITYTQAPDYEPKALTLAEYTEKGLPHPWEDFVQQEACCAAAAIANHNAALDAYMGVDENGDDLPPRKFTTTITLTFEATNVDDVQVAVSDITAALDADSYATATLTDWVALDSDIKEVK
jgi:hypothetical protein